jgi:hypothetical protein
MPEPKAAATAACVGDNALHTWRLIKEEEENAKAFVEEYMVRGRLGQPKTKEYDQSRLVGQELNACTMSTTSARSDNVATSHGSR